LGNSNKPNLKPSKHAVVKKWFERTVYFVLFGPFVLIFLFALTGSGMPEGGPFTIWFLGSLTVAGLVTTVGSAQSVRDHGWKELGCALPIAAFTCWLGYLGLKEVVAWQ
jgi:hypothetical protein